MPADSDDAHDEVMWNAAMAQLRAQGEDPDALLAQAAANVAAWRAVPRDEWPTEHIADEA